MSGRSRAFIVGCGYLGRRLGRELARDQNVFGLVSSTRTIKWLRSLRIEPVVLDLDRAKPGDLSTSWIRKAALFYLVPPRLQGDSDVRLDRFLQLLPEKPRVFVYLSTTGVYGETNGQEVAESTPVNPTSARARRRVSAEHMTRVWCTENEVRRVVLRVPAIYGPGRLPLERLRNGEPSIRESEAGVTNRIHVDDLVQICLNVADDASARGVYNVSDGNTHTLTEFLNRVAAAAELPPPPQISLDEAQLTFDPERLSFFESRRVSNRRICEELGIQLKYADVDMGIRASLLEEASYKKREK